MIFRSVKKFCTSNEFDGTKINAIFEECDNDYELDTGDIHPDVPMKGSYSKE